MIGYCVKCRKKREMDHITKARMKSGRPFFKGTCSVCGTKMARIGSN